MLSQSGLVRYICTIYFYSPHIYFSSPTEVIPGVLPSMVLNGIQLVSDSFPRRSSIMPDIV
jgi:hypothetical protein